jgi:flagellar basal body-associated protein FliL
MNKYGSSGRDPFRKRGKQGLRRRSPQFLQKTEQPKKEEKKRTSLIPALILVALTVVIGGLSLLYFGIVSYSPEEAEDTQNDTVIEDDVSAAGYDFIADKENRKILYLKPDFIVNLRGLDGNVIFRVSIWLEVSDLAIANELNSDRAKFFRLMDDITRTLKSWSYAELTIGNGMENLKAQLRDRANQYISSGIVERVIFKKPVFNRVLPPVKIPEQE